MAKYDWNMFRNYVAFLADEMASGTMHPHHDSELISWYHDAFLPWDHSLNNIMLFYHDSPITRSHFMDPTDRAIKGFYCSWSIACRRCSNYIFIPDLTSGFKGFGKDSRKTVWESFKCWDLVHLILETWRYLSTCTRLCSCPRWMDKPHRSNRTSGGNQLESGQLLALNYAQTEMGHGRELWAEKRNVVVSYFIWKMVSKKSLIGLCLAHWGRVTHKCIGNVAWLVASHYLNQCCHIVN